MALSITKVLEIIEEHVTTLSSEIIPIEESLGRILAQEYRANFNLPRFDNSAMDGYAVKVADQNRTVESNKVIYAGDNSNYRLQEGEAIRIMTGAPIPDGCEAIVPIEDISFDGERVILPDNIKGAKHIRRAGEDIKKGATYAYSGDVVTAYTLAIFASQGVTHITVVRRVRVALFGTGDELRPHYEKIETHQLYNSNAPMFLARAKEMGCDVTYIGGSGDTIDSLKRCITKALWADLIITSGGVSVGDKDFTKEAFAQLGMETLFSGVDIKPGKPTTLGRIGAQYIVNLPGNPLAAMVNYEMFVKIVIYRLSGRSACYHGVIESKMREDFTLKEGKHTVTLGRWDGVSFAPIAQQSPGMVSPLSQADVMMVTTPDKTTLLKDEKIRVIPIKWDISLSKKEEFLNKCVSVNGNAPLHHRS